MLRSRLRADKGFTLVELLVVMLILGILVAVGLASFLGQKSKAQDAEAKSVAVTASKAALAYGTDHDGYSGMDVDELTKIEVSLGQARNLGVTADAGSFTVSVDSAAGTGIRYSIERTADGGVVRDCTKPGLGGCRDERDANGNRW
jgi:type IV pilus assembly protein PilA